MIGRRHRHHLAVVPIALAALSATPAFAAERVAVIVTAPNPADASLADNLTDVTMARVAQRGHQVAGAEEFRARLGGPGGRGAERCAEEAACLGRAAVSLGVTEILIGAVRARQGQYMFDLTLHDLRGGAADNRTFRLVDGPLSQLIRQRAGRRRRPVQASPGSRSPLRAVRPAGRASTHRQRRRRHHPDAGADR